MSYLIWGILLILALVVVVAAVFAEGKSVEQGKKKVLRKMDDDFGTSGKNTKAPNKNLRPSG